MNTQPREITGWAGWAVFAAFMMALIGAMDIITGLVAVFDDKWLVGGGGKLYVVDSTAWGWVTICIGTILIFAAAAVMRGAVWGRLIAVLLAGANAIWQLSVMRAYPIWALLIIVLDIFVIYGVIVHGGELRED